MSPEELLAELRSNAEEIDRLASKVKGVSRWDTTMVVSNTTLAATGIVLAVPTGGLSLGLTVISMLLIAADLAKKASELSDEPLLQARLRRLHERNARLTAEIRRRMSLE